MHAAPSPPTDPTVKKVADKLASFVAKNGRQFEYITRQRNPGDTPFKYVFFYAIISIWKVWCLFATDNQPGRGHPHEVMEGRVLLRKTWTRPLCNPPENMTCIVTWTYNMRYFKLSKSIYSSLYLLLHFLWEKSVFLPYQWHLCTISQYHSPGLFTCFACFFFGLIGFAVKDLLFSFCSWIIMEKPMIATFNSYHF